MRLRTILRTGHQWVGLGAAALLMLQGASGILWANQEALTVAFHPEARVAANGRETLDNVLKAVAGRYPGAQLDRVAFPKDPRTALVARVVTQQKSMNVLLIDPSTARVLSSGPIWLYPEQFAERLHGSLLAGKTGRWIVFSEGVLLVILAGSGLVLWWPGLAGLGPAFTIHISAPPRRLLRDLHLAPGAVAALLLLLTGLTGVLMASEPLAVAMVSHLAPMRGDITRAPQVAVRPQAPMTAQQALDVLQRRFPRGRVTKLRTLGANEGALLASFIDPQSSAPPNHNPTASDIAAIDRVTGAVTVIEDASDQLAGDALMGWLAPTHGGEIYGFMRPVITTGIGAILIMMVITGISNWLARPRLSTGRKA